MRSLLSVALFVLLLWSPAGAQRVPSWLHTPPRPAGGAVYGIGMSDLGLSGEAAYGQAYRRAVCMARLGLLPEVQTTVIASVLIPGTGVADFDPRNTLSVDIRLPALRAPVVREAGRFESGGIHYVLVSLKAAETIPEETAGRLSVSRDDSRGREAVTIRVESWADSVIIDLVQRDGVTEFRSAFPDVQERIRVDDGDLTAPSKTPAWMKQQRNGTAADVVAMKGRFAPFMSYLQAAVTALGEQIRAGNEVEVEYDDAMNINGRTEFATVTRVSRFSPDGAHVDRLQISRSGALYQAILRVATKR